LKSETKAGHGIGKPLTKLIDDTTDIWTFVLWQLGMDGAAAPPPGAGRTDAAPSR